MQPYSKYPTLNMHGHGMLSAVLLVALLPCVSCCCGCRKHVLDLLMSQSSRSALTSAPDAEAVELLWEECGIPEGQHLTRQAWERFMLQVNEPLHTLWLHHPVLHLVPLDAHDQDSAAQQLPAYACRGLRNAFPPLEAAAASSLHAAGHRC